MIAKMLLVVQNLLLQSEINLIDLTDYWSLVDRCPDLNNNDKNQELIIQVYFVKLCKW